MMTAPFKIPSKSVVVIVHGLRPKKLGLFLFCVALWFLLRAFHVFHIESCLALCSRVFSVLFSVVISSLGEERAGLCISRAFVCLFCTR